MVDLAVPPVLVRNAVEAWGEEGRRWLADLPMILDAVADDWRLRIGRTFELSYHWVAEATREDGSAAVLKLGPPQPGHLAIEAATLDFYNGDGAVRLLAHDPARGALLLERAAPGTLMRSLVPRRDEEATAAAITVMRRLRASREAWLAIDPHGYVGDRGYETGALLHNPDPDDRDGALLKLVPARVEQLADGLGLPVERVAAWGFVKAVLSEVWTAEGGGTPGGRALDVAVQLLPQLP